MLLATESALRTIDADLVSFAQNYPELIYRLRQAGMLEPGVNQQTPQVIRAPRLNTEMGSNNEANSVGNAMAAAAKVGGNIGVSALEQATNPMVQEQLIRQPMVENLPALIRQRLSAF